MLIDGIMIFKEQSKLKEDYIVQFEDLSLVYIENGSRVRWVREESLSQVTQVEIMDQEVIRLESDLEYVKNVK